MRRGQIIILISPQIEHNMETTPLTKHDKLPSCPWRGGVKPSNALDLTIYQKSWLALAIIRGAYNYSELRKALKDVSRKALRKWVTILETEGEWNDGPGRPPLMNEEGHQQLVEFVRDQSSSLSKTLPEIKAKIIELINDPSITDISERTFHRILKHNKIMIGTAEETTDARAAAVSDKRNAYSFAVMNKICTSISVPQLICNADSTQFIVGSNSNGKISVGFTERKDGKPLKVLPQKRNRQGLGYAIKFYLLISADGSRSDPVFIVAHDSMPADACDPHSCPSISTNTKKAWIVFLKSRIPNIAFCEWYMKHVVIPFVNQQRDKHMISADVPAYFTLDGEAKQIEVFSEDINNVIQDLDEAKVIVGKPPASTTAITQPCDRGIIFKDLKRKLKKVNEADVTGAIYKDRMDELNKIFKAHMTSFPNKQRYANDDKKPSDESVDEETPEDHPSKESSSSDKKKPKEHDKSFTSTKQLTAKYGLLRVAEVVDGSIEPVEVMKSFSYTGIYPFDIHQIFEEFCDAQITDQEKLEFIKVFPKLVQRMQTKGELTDEDFDEFNLGMEAPRKDNLVMYRRRSCILTNINFILREYAKKEAKIVAKATQQPKKRGRKRKSDQVTLEAQTPQSSISVAAKTNEIKRAKKN